MPQCLKGHNMIEGTDFCSVCGARPRPDPPAGDSVIIDKSTTHEQKVIVNQSTWSIPLLFVLMGVIAVVAFFAGNQWERGNAPVTGSTTPQVIDRVVRETVLVEKPITAEVTRLATVIAEKEVPRVVEKPVEKRVEVPVVQTVIVERVAAPSATPTATGSVLLQADFSAGTPDGWVVYGAETRSLGGQYALEPVMHFWP